MMAVPPPTNPEPGITILTSSMLVADVAVRWKEQYYDRGGRGKWYDVYKEEMYQRLLALPLPLNPIAVDDIIGNDSWTTFECGCCHRFSQRIVVQFHQQFSRDSLLMCFGCVKGAYGLVQFCSGELK